jgi:hypothetical protein
MNKSSSTGQNVNQTNAGLVLTISLEFLVKYRIYLNDCSICYSVITKTSGPFGEVGGVGSLIVDYWELGGIVAKVLWCNAGIDGIHPWLTKAGHDIIFGVSHYGSKVAVSSTAAVGQD